MDKNRNCKERTLGPQDCMHHNKYSKEVFIKYKSINPAKIIVIPGGMTQGYVILDGFLKKGEINLSMACKFGLPGLLEPGYSAWMAFSSQANKCCGIEDVCMIKTPVKSLYVSQLHKVQKITEMMDDLKELLSIQKYEVTLNPLRKEYITQTGRLKGLIRMRTGTYPLKQTFEIWDIFTGKEKGKIFVVPKAEELVVRTEEYVETLFRDFQSIITGFYYPKKVLEVLGQ